jgi:hypothetical protein
MDVIQVPALVGVWLELARAKRISTPFQHWYPVSGRRTTAAMGAVHLERGPNVAILRSGCVRTVWSGAGGGGQTHLWGPCPFGKHA